MIYSVELAHANVAAGIRTAVFTAGSDAIYVVRDIAVHHTNATGQDTGVQKRSPGGVGVWLARNATLSPSVPLLWQGRQVLPAGYTIEVFCVGGNVNVTVSGYRLT